MATTVHIPKKLLEQVDARAKSLGVSRNRLVVDALRDKVAVIEAWSPELLAMLATPPDASVREESREMNTAIRRARRGRKKPVQL